jgi:hypothetical protein
MSSVVSTENNTSSTLAVHAMHQFSAWQWIASVSILTWACLAVPEWVALHAACVPAPWAASKPPISWAHTSDEGTTNDNDADGDDHTIFPICMHRS